MTEAAKAVELPPRPFLYTLDQVATLLDLALNSLRAHYVWYEGRSTGRRPVDLLRAVNIAPAGKRPEYRITEAELTRWLRARRIAIYDTHRLRYTTARD